MTASFSQNGDHPKAMPLRVVPPHQIASVAPPLPAGSDAVDPVAEAIEPHPGTSKRWLILASTLMGITALGFIPIPYQVGGTVQLDWKETTRQSVHPPITAVVKQVRVKTGETVQPGQVLAIVASRDLDQDIALVQERLAQAQQALQTARQEQVQRQANQLEVSARAQAARVRSARSQERVAQLQQGVLTPDMATLAIEQQRLVGQLQEVDIQVRRYETLYQQGAVSLADWESYQIQYRNLERDLANKTEQIRATQQQLIDTAVDDAAATATQTATVIAAGMVTDTATSLTVYERSIQMLEQQLLELQTQREALTLRATTAGTVMTSDLDLLVGQEVHPDTVLLQVANLNQLTANVQVSEEDLNFVEKGAAVTFRPRQAKLESYSAQVADILYNMQTDNTQQQRVATVRVVIDNPDGKLRPGSSGYARIFSEWIPLYQQVGREILKLVPERFL
jgi:multidrug resistance efflux pump